MDSKTKWRQKNLAERDKLSPQFIAEASQKIAVKFLSLEEFRLAERIALYASMRGEVETDAIFRKAHPLRKEIFFPAVDEVNRLLHFHRVDSLKDLEPGYHGILEPKNRSHPLGNINFLNLIVVPGVAFDPKGNRVGFGGGYYDRILETFKGIRVALAFDFQICSKLPSHSKDQRVDMIVSEERILKVT